MKPLVILGRPEVFQGQSQTVVSVEEVEAVMLHAEEERWVCREGVLSLHRTDGPRPGWTPYGTWQGSKKPDSVAIWMKVV
mmetsp:Transcript_34677/g.56265  ORF Transcript_34677/g.56265 Transcript_34677/m.56265 type:complete len:80 (+) Transcript_34677:118-357(+)